MRSILFGLACAPAAAINFTERYEPLIRLANGACNLAEAKTHSTLNCRSTATEAEKKEKKKNCNCSDWSFSVWVCDDLIVRPCMYTNSYRSMCATVWGFGRAGRYYSVRVKCFFFFFFFSFSLEDLKASWQLLIFHQKKARLKLFTWHTPLFLCLSQIGWKWNGLFLWWAGRLGKKNG